jgi:hypothetical protein
MPICSSVFPTTSCSYFKVSGLMLRSLIHFEFILVKGERQGPSFSLLHVDIQFSQQHLLKRLSFLYHVFWGPLLKISCLQLHEFMSGSSDLIHWSSCVFLCQYHAVFFVMAL